MFMPLVKSQEYVRQKMRWKHSNTFSMYNLRFIVNNSTEKDDLRVWGSPRLRFQVIEIFCFYFSNWSTCFFVVFFMFMSIEMVY